MMHKKEPSLKPFFLFILLFVAGFSFFFFRGFEHLSFVPRETLTAQAGPGVNEVFIRNKNSFAVTNQPVNIPISFQRGQHVCSFPDLTQAPSCPSLANVKIGTLPTQVAATTFYNDGSVKTAIAHVLVSLSANQYQTYPIGTGSSPAFQMNPDVNDLIRNQNNKSLKAHVKDIRGGDYEVVLDVDGYPGKCNGFARTMPTNCVRVLEDGPVAKIWEIHKRHDPVIGGPTEDLTYLFTSVFIVTVFSGSDNVLVDHVMVNSNNLDEEPAPATTGGPKNNGYNYANAQHGAIFYTNAGITIDTGTANNRVYVLDANIIKPSFKCTSATPHPDCPNPVTAQKTVFWIMPSDGQTELSQNYGEGPSVSAIPEQSNYIGFAQSIATRLVVSFSLASFHPLDESNINSGQSLARWAQVDDSMFRELPSPSAINPSFSFASDAQNRLNSYINEVNNPANGHRFGEYILSPVAKNLTTGGYYNQYYADAIEGVRYFLSCEKECQREYIDGIRFGTYNSAHITNFIVGFAKKNHPETNMNAYGSPLLERIVSQTYDCTDAWNPKDWLGMCQSYPNKQQHITDPNGRTLYTTNASTFGNTYTAAGGQPWHGWANKEPAHLSLSIEYYRYLLSGDYLSRFQVISQGETSPSPVLWNIAHGFLGDLQSRHRGRSLIWISHLYGLTQDPAYKPLATSIINNVANPEFNVPDCSRGTNPTTGDCYPVGIYASQVQNEEPDSGNPSSIYKSSRFFMDSIISQGIAIAYREMFTPGVDAGVMNVVKQTIAKNLHGVYTYQSKAPDEIRNWAQGMNGQLIFEGNPGISNYLATLVWQPSNTPNLKWITYGHANEEVYAGLCNELVLASEIRKTDPNFLKNGAQDLFQEYYQEFRDNFIRKWVIKSDGITFPSLYYGINLSKIYDETICGLTFAQGIPTGSGGGFVNGFYQSSISKSCPDNDNDGFTTCAGDSNDNNFNVNPGRTEQCTNGIDDNSDGLIDCNDKTCGGMQWTGSSWTPINSGSGCFTNNIPKAGYCGNFILDPGEECDAPSTGGPPGTPQGVNTCGGIGGGLPLDPQYTAQAQGYCVPAFNPLSEGCTCASGVSIAQVGVTTNGVAAEPNIPGRLVFARTGGDTSQPLQITYSIGGTATPGVDYITLSGSVTIPSTQSEITVPVIPIDDTLVESTERVNVTITGTSDPNATITFPSAQMDILDDDGGVIVTVEATDPSASEDAGNTGLFTLSRSGSPANPLTVNISLTGTATNGADYQTITTSYTIPGGQSGLAITVTPIDDAIAEGIETVILTVVAGSGYTPGGANSAQVDIADNDSSGGLTGDSTIKRVGSNLLTSSAPSGTQAKMDTGAPVNNNPATFTSLSTGSHTAWSTDVPNFTEKVATCTYPIGGTECSLPNVNLYTIVPICDGTFCRTQISVSANTVTKVVYLYEASAPATPDVTIVTTDASAGEQGPDTGLFTISRTGSTASSLTVNLSISGLATNGIDYQTVSTTKSIPAGQSSATVLITPIDDTIVESGESVTLTLATGANYNVGSPSSASLTITDNDSPPPPPPAPIGTPFCSGTTSKATITWTDGGLNGAQGYYVDIDNDNNWVNGFWYKFIPAGTTSTVAPDSFIPTVITQALSLNANQAYQIRVMYSAAQLYSLVGSFTATNCSGPTLPVVIITASDGLASEPGSNTGVFNISRTGDTTNNLDVFFTISGSATNGTDYQTLPVKATILAGNTSTSLTVTPIDDTLVESAEIVTLTLNTNTQYSIGSINTATVTILDDDTSTSGQTVPEPPSQLTAVAITSSYVQLTWIDNSNNENGFKIERSSSGSTSGFSEINTSPANLGFFDDITVGGGATYWYRIKAFNDVGSSNYSNTVSVSTPSEESSSNQGNNNSGLIAPGNLVAYSIKPNTVRLFWKGSSSGQTGYKLEMSTDGKKFNEINILPPHYYFWNEKTLSPGTQYYFRIRAYDATGNSDYSNLAEVTTKTEDGGESGSFIFVIDRNKGDKGNDVKVLQQCLNQNGFIVSSSGPGSPGSETDYYGVSTTKAVKNLQNANPEEILIPVGIPPGGGTGYFGPSTRSFMNALGCAGGSVSGDPFTQTLQEGDSGEDVLLLQLYLAQNKVIYPEGTITGIYDPLTTNAVKNFQKKTGLPETGVLDFPTRILVNLYYDAIP